MFELVFVEPAHFHAALTLRAHPPRTLSRVHLYARPGPDREAFLALVRSFNERPHAPTAWALDVHSAGEPLERFLRDHPPEGREGRPVVVLAGRNDRKLAWIRAAREAGFPVLADKPWLTDPAQLPDLAAVVDGQGPPVMDMMTGRFDAWARLRRLITRSEALFGRPVSGDGEPAIVLCSRHHLLKKVDGRVLRRPPWYFDVRVQGDGLVDIQSHMVDQVQWLVDEGARMNPALEAGADEDVRLSAARRWSTPVDLELYREVTGQARFSPPLEPLLEGGVLPLACNGEIGWRIRDIEVRQRAEWGGREPEGSGDQHAAILNGRRGRIVHRQSELTGFRPQLTLSPADALSGREREAWIGSLHACVRAWQDEIEGLAVEPGDGQWSFRIPPASAPGHEAHFPMVLAGFLAHLEHDDWPPTRSRVLATRYTLLARARHLADRRREEAGKR